MAPVTGLAAERRAVQRVHQSHAARSGLRRQFPQHHRQPAPHRAIVVGQRRDRPLVLMDAHRRQRLHGPHDGSQLPDCKGVA
ncbi:MAG: hypothetical protein R3F36_10500 [Candidatus Competibacteraceae bacterium]